MIRKHLHLLLILSLAFSISEVQAQLVIKTYALHQVELVDVINREVLSDQTVVVHDSRIIGIYSSDEFKPSDSVQVLNMKGRYLLPGLIDAHVHMATDATKETRANAEEVLKAMLLTGITSVRDMAGDARALASLSRDALVGDIDAPDVHYSALMAGPEFFTDPRTIATAKGGTSGAMPYMKAVDDNTNLPLAVAEARGTGAAGIKLYAALPENLVHAIVAEAGKQNIPVWAHGSLIPTRPSGVLTSGVISVSHANMLINEFFPSRNDVPESWVSDDILDKSEGFWDDEYNKLSMGPLLEMMNQQDVVLDATLSVFEKYKDRASYRWRYEIARCITMDAKSKGVKVAAGSDTDQQTFVQHEMKLLVNECGFTPFEAITSATLYAAEATGISGQTGSITVGKKADILLLSSDPTAAIDNIDDVALVIKGGRLFSAN